MSKTSWNVSLKVLITQQFDGFVSTCQKSLAFLLKLSRKLKKLLLFQMLKNVTTSIKIFYDTCPKPLQRSLLTFLLGSSKPIKNLST